MLAMKVAAAIYLYNCSAWPVTEMNVSVPEWQVDLASSCAVKRCLGQCLHGISFTL